MNLHKGITNWRKSSRSTTANNCVEMGWTTSQTVLRDTKQAGMPDEARPALVFGRDVVMAFLADVKTGRYDVA